MFFKLLVSSHILFLLLALVNSRKNRVDDITGSKIVGGQPIQISQAPYMAIFSINNRNITCGAFIIGRRHFLTAAHCLELRPFNNPKVKVGNTFVHNFTKVYNVTKWFVHPEYDPNFGENDVGVFVINETLKWSPFVAPIALAYKGFIVPDGAPVKVRGWGYTNETTRSLPDQLQEVQVPVVSQQVCSEEYAEFNTSITEKLLCAGTAGKDNCNGDSGGPLTYQGWAVGIVSFGVGCGLPGYPSVYTRVSSVRSWIDGILCKTGFCDCW